MLAGSWARDPGRISARIWDAGMEGEREEAVDAVAPAVVVANGLGGEEDYVVVKSADEDGAAAAAELLATDGGDDLADGESAVGSATAVAAPEEPASAPTKVRATPNYCALFALPVALFPACWCIAGGY